MSVVPTRLDLRGSNTRDVLHTPLPRPAALTVVGAAGAAAQIVLAADPASPNILCQIFASLSGAATAAVTIQVLDGAAVIFSWTIGVGVASMPPVTFDPPIAGTANQTMTLAASAPGGALVVSLNCNAYVRK